MEDKILELLEQTDYITIKTFASYGFDPGELSSTLDRLLASGEIVKTRAGKYALAKTMGYIKGTLEVKRGGFAFVRNIDGDIFVSAENLNGALNGESVMLILTERSHSKNREGSVKNILSSQPYKASGTFLKSNRSAFVRCDDQSVPDIFIPRQYAGGAKDGQKVVVQIQKRALKNKSPEGKIVEILGFAGSKGVDSLSVARTFSLPDKFTSSQIAQAEKLSKPVCEKDLEGRRRLLDETIFTIDGADAKDLDDAISLEKTRKGEYILGVHIADVSHYIKPGSALDKEAYKRGTSVYLLDKVIPMLPPQISNGICSLTQDVLRLTLSCFMHIDKLGNVTSSSIEKTAIISRHRMTYSDVNLIFKKDAELCKRYKDIQPMLNNMLELSRILRKKREAAGGIDFDIAEAKIELDKQDRPINIGLRERGDAEKMIEDFMLTCNETVAEYFFYQELPFLYRIHETPDPDRIQALSTFLSNFGYRIMFRETINPKMLQQVLKKAEGSPYENIINSVTLRSLKKARYSPQNEGHFGIASKVYCHFTSPIRRYPDLQIHRMIGEYIKSDYSRLGEYERILPAVGTHTSETERRAIEAERKVEDIKKAEYIDRFIGKKFEGVVSGVSGGAIFVQLSNTIEGVIPLSTITDDYYELVADMYCVIGTRTKRRINLGDTVRIIVHSTIIQTGRVEFRLYSR